MSHPNPSLLQDLERLPAAICEANGLTGAILLIRDAQGTVQFCGHGVNNAIANEMLSIGIYCNLDQHYRSVEQGLAGAEAQRIAEEIKQRNEVTHA
ncbi:hypothetical protein [Aquitalea aquatilis]|uniref:hypothetical protein n=1 Tax=Aquitalea aquatilis TaxID=1537400 RepID=UPI0010BD6A52|nr:hypothetical protein [Aquitalea aquatilis]